MLTNVLLGEIFKKEYGTQQITENTCRDFVYFRQILAKSRSYYDDNIGHRLNSAIPIDNPLQCRKFLDHIKAIHADRRQKLNYCISVLKKDLEKLKNDNSAGLLSKDKESALSFENDISAGLEKNALDKSKKDSFSTKDTLFAADPIQTKETNSLKSENDNLVLSKKLSLLESELTVEDIACERSYILFYNKCQSIR